MNNTENIITALEKAKEILKKEPDHPIVDYVTLDAINYLREKYDYDLPKIDLRQTRAANATKSETEKIELKTKLINGLIDILKPEKL